MKTLSTAPVALFVYNRLHNTKQTIEHLKKNKLADRTPLYIFSDGGKDKRSWKEVNRLRKYLHTIDGFGEVHIVERPENYYLENNIIEGIAYVLQHHDTIIVLEDDICTSPVFLEYMNNALNKYIHTPRMGMGDMERPMAALRPFHLAQGSPARNDCKRLRETGIRR